MEFISDTFVLPVRHNEDIKLQAINAATGAIGNIATSTIKKLRDALVQEHKLLPLGNAFHN